MKKLVAVVAMSGAMMFGITSVAMAEPNGPNRAEIVKSFKSRGIDVAVFVDGYDGKGSSCEVVRQTNLNNRTDLKYVKNKETEKMEWVRVSDPKVIIHLKCRKG